MRSTWRLTLLTAVAATLAMGAPAQDDPFAAPPAGQDPFAASTTEAVADPFAASAAQPPAAAAPATEASPFQPSFGAAASPFDAPAGAAAPADPFAAPGAAPAADPFAAAGAPAAPAAPQADPFAAAGATADPFGAPAAPAGDPFGAPVAAEAGDPFGAPPPPAATASAGDPFGAPAGAPAPGAPASPDAANPFAVADSAPAAPADGTAAATGTGVSRLFQFRYLEQERLDGSRVAVRKAMTKEEAEVFDSQILTFYTELANSGQLPGFTPGVDDVADWAQWMAYAYQVKLWQAYVETIVLVGSGFEEGTVTVAWPGDPAPGAEAGAVTGEAGGEGTSAGRGKDGGAAPSARPARPANIINENRSLDDQLADFNPLADTRSGGQGRTVYSPRQMDERTVAAYTTYLNQLRTYEEEQVAFMVKLKDDLETRQLARDAYQEWRDGQLDSVLEFVEEWNRRYEGDVTVIAGVRYELYRPDNVPTETIRGANVVITDYDLTPYDLLNEDGSLRGPAD